MQPKLGWIQVYPRVCGGTGWSCRHRRCARGLSPRVRGNPFKSGANSAIDGSIPACAGEPAATIATPIAVKVYPRVCGGTSTWSLATPSPEGLSPRVRGNQPRRIHAPFSDRSIPACAGEPPHSSNGRHCVQVYPRVCGGTTAGPSFDLRAAGLSPRVRGNRAVLPPAVRRIGSIPACAGEPPPYTSRCARPEVYPRVCGGTPSARARRSV